MPDTYCAVGCENRRPKKGDKEDGHGKGLSLSFFRLPAASTPLKAEKRRLWLFAIRRENWSKEQQERARLCGNHFISGKPSDDPQDPDFVPSLFKYKKSNPKGDKQKKERRERAMRRESQDPLPQRPAHTNEQAPDPQKEQEVAEILVEMQFEAENCAGDENGQEACRCEELLQENGALQLEVTNLRKELADARDKNEKLKEKIFSYNNVKNDQLKLKFYTGLRTTALFMWLLTMCKKAMKFKRVRNTSCDWSDQLLMVLMKMRLGLMDKDIAYRFGIHRTTVSRIMRAWIPNMATLLKETIIWPSRLAVRQHLPKCFKKRFKKTVAIIDCTEIFIERPLNLTARAETYSNYKNHNTIKYFVGITPSGAISFLPPGWGGRVSDKELTVKSGFLDKVDYGDEVLADRGFNIKEELAIRGCCLRVPSYTKGKKQLSKEEVDKSRQLSQARIHVERVIGRIKKFNILQTTIPITQVDMLDDMMTICAGLTNLNLSVVPRY